MWVNSQLEPDSAFYNIPLEIGLVGPLDVDALVASVYDVIERHEILRTVYRQDEDRLVQIVRPASAVPVRHVDLCDLTAEAARDALRALGSEIATQPFSLETGPVLRVALARLGPEHHVLFWTTHHIAADGWTSRLISLEVSSSYEALRGRRLNTRELLPIQYADFATWQRTRNTPHVLERELQFWKENLEGAPREIVLPTDRPRPPVLTSRGEQVTLPLSHSSVAKLQALAHREQTTSFTLFVAALAIVMHRLSAQRDFVIGTVAAGRSVGETESLIGNFVNFVPLRIQVSESSTLAECSRGAHEAVMNALAHGDCPFHKIVAAVNDGRTTTRNGLYNVALLYQNHPYDTRTVIGETGLRIEARSYGEKRASALDLRFIVMDLADQPALVCEYHPDLFDESTAVRYTRYYAAVLEALTESPNVLVEDLPLSTPVEARAMLARSAAAARYPVTETLHGRFAMHARQSPDAVALVCGEDVQTYAGLATRARRVAAALTRRGIGPGSYVGLSVERSLSLVAAILGILQTGAAYVPLDPSYPAERLAFMAKDAGVRIVIAQVGVDPKIDDVELLMMETLEPDDGDTLPPREVSPALPAYLIYTSGSTGQPKGVLVSHAHVLRLFESTRRHFSVGPADVWTVFHSYAFDFSVWEIWGALLHGGRAVLVPRATAQSPDELCDLIRTNGVTVLSQTPSAFRQLMRAEEALASRLTSLRYIVFGAEALDVSCLARWFERYGDEQPRLINMYGITETTVHVTYHRVRMANAASTIGRPLDDLSTYVLDRQMRPVPVGVAGELFVGGDGVTYGYLGRSALTAERFVPDPFGSTAGARLYRTGDLARVRGDGDYEYLGRVDHQVKIRGFRIELGEIESALRAYPDVREAIVIASADASGSERLVAYVVWSGSPPATSHALRIHLKAKLPEFMIPAAFMSLPALPLTPSGKVNRRALPLPETTRDVVSDYVPPSTPVEDALVGIWQAVLGIELVGVTDDFFDLGGHSLSAIQVMTQVRRAFAVHLPLRTLYEQPTVSSLARALATIDASSHEEVVLPNIESNARDRDEPFPLTDIQQAYWVGRSGEYDLAVACHVYFEFDNPHLDVDRLQRGWCHLIARHEMLRAIVRKDGRQQILPSVPAYCIFVDDLSATDAEAAGRTLDSTRARMSHQVLPADQWPLFEIRVTRRPDGAPPRVHFSIDMLIVDAGSLMLLADELAQLYTEPNTSLPPLELSFRDYVLAEHAFQSTPTFARSLAYWQARLATFPAGPELPLARLPSTVTSPQFVRRDHRLPVERWSRFKAQARRAGLSASGAVMAAFTELLFSWSANSRFAITVTLFNRLPFHRQVNDIVGDFTSITFVEADAKSGDTFEERAKSLQSQLIDALEHRYVSGVRLLRELVRKRGSAIANIPVVFTSVLGLPRAAGEAELASESEWELGYYITQTPQVWLDHQMREEGGDLYVSWDVIEELFPSGVIDAMWSAYVQLLDDLCDPATWRALSPATWRALSPVTRHTGASASIAPEPLVRKAMLDEVVLAQAVRTPSATAVVTPTRRLDYRELDALSATVARWLSEHEAGRAECVAIVMRKGWEQVVAALGILRAGAAYVPIDPDLPEERLEALLTQSGARLVLTQGVISSTGRLGSRPALAVDRCEGRLDAAPYARAERDEEDLAYVLFTSGSTGSPKGVMIPHRGPIATIEDVNRRFDVSSSDRAIGLSALTFDLSVYDVFGLLAAGGTLVLPDASRERDPAHWLELLVQEGVTVWNTVPALLQILVEHVERRGGTLPSSLRLVMLSGDWIPVTLPDRLRRLAPSARVVSLGGPTEASIWQAVYPVDEVAPEWTSIPYGKPLAGHTLHVLDERLAPRPPWVRGEIYIGGRGLALGYLGDPEKTAAAFVTHPRTGERLYRSGDFARWLPDGNLEFLGRADGQVKVHGYRIELGEIEANLERYPEVLSAAARVFGDAHGAKRLVAYVVPRSTADQQSDEPFEQAWRGLIAAADAAAVEPFVYDPVHEARFEAYADRLFVAYGAQALQKLGAFGEETTRLTEDELRARGEIVPDFRRWLHRLLMMLVARGVIEHADGTYRLLDWTKAEEVAALWKEIGPAGNNDVLRFVRATAESIPSILRGDTRALEILFPEGGTETASTLYSEGTLGRCIGRCRAVAAQISRSWPIGRNLRVLEIGAGVGATSGPVLDELDPARTEYVYTDLSKFFLRKGRELFGHHAFVDFTLLDIENDPETHGFKPHTFDLVIASSVIHGTRDLRRTLRNVQKLLAPGGVFLFVEETRWGSFYDLSYGFQRGFERFEDEDLRPLHPFLSSARWLSLLQETGFASAHVVSEPGIPNDTEHAHVFLARMRADNAAAAIDPEALQAHLKKCLPDYMIPRTVLVLDRLPLTANGKVDRGALPEPNVGKQVEGPQRAADTALEEALTVIFADVLDVEQVGVEDNFFAIGGDSLLATTLTSHIRELLSVDVSLRSLFDAPTVARLAARLATDAGVEERAAKMLAALDDEPAERST